MTDTDTATEAGTFDERLHDAARHRYGGVTTLARWERDAFCAGARWARTDAAASTVTAEQVEAAAEALWRQVFGHGWEGEPDGVRAYWRRDAAAVLTAAGFTVPEEVQA